LIIDPPDGRIPAFTVEGAKREEARKQDQDLHGFDGPENRSPWERCIVAINAGPPMMPTNYNSNYQIVQAPGYVVVLSEQIHDARVIPLDERPHLPAGVRQWKGNSTGHWDHETLVVETTNFTGLTNFGGITANASERLRLTEHFTRVASDMILYEFTVDDPVMYTRTWTVQIPLQAAKGRLYEYACHEGNYGMANLLSGARADERAAEKAKKEAK
jgi:hypothetical protein